jgi:NAD(P)H-dependent FMN reductase
MLKSLEDFLRSGRNKLRSLEKMSRILAFAGSARRDSFNKKLVALAAAKARNLGAEVTLVDLADYPIPLYDGDLESTDGLPDNALRLRQLMLEHDALLISCPEYNGSITPLLKNTIDWTSRPSDGIGQTAAYQGKVGCLLSASPGGLGGMRGLVHVRAILSGIGVLVIPGDVSVGGAFKAFAEDGSLADEKIDGRLNKAIEALVTTTSALKG